MNQLAHIVSCSSMCSDLSFLLSCPFPGESAVGGLGVLAVSVCSRWASQPGQCGSGLPSLGLGCLESQSSSDFYGCTFLQPKSLNIILFFFFTLWHFVSDNSFIPFPNKDFCSLQLKSFQKQLECQQVFHNHEVSCEQSNLQPFLE